MQSLTKNKNLLAGVLLFVMLMLIYQLFLKGDGVVEEGPSAAEAGADLVALAEELSTARLDQELFNKPTYRYLTDFSTPLPTPVLGRPNPFEIIGRD